jgi:hypothetical protein
MYKKNAEIIDLKIFLIGRTYQQDLLNIFKLLEQLMPESLSQNNQPISFILKKYKVLLENISRTKNK